MAFDVNFRFVSAARYAPGACIVRWSVLPHAHPSQDLRFSLFRSSSLAGPWDLVTEDLSGAFQFVDYAVFSPVTSRPYYYRVRACAPSGAGYVDSKPVGAAPESDNIAQEMVRKKLTFMLTKSGGPLAVLIRRTWGPNCNRCYNHQRQVATDSNCPDCFGTGYTGGYLSPYYTPAIINPGRKAIISAGVEYDTAKLYVEIASVPVVSPQDVIVDTRQNIRYVVGDVTPFTHRQAIVSQVCVLNRCDENSVLYTVPVAGPASAEYGRGWDLLGEANFRRTMQDAYALPT